MMRARALLLTAVAVVLSGCAGGSALFGAATGRVTGHVVSRACGGAYREDQPGCHTAPLAGEVLNFRLRGSSDVETATTDSAGAYRIDLKPGTYAIDLRAPNAAPQAATLTPCACRPPHFAGPTTLSVTAGKSLVADFSWTIELL
jgi:hypothetical protein